MNMHVRFGINWSIIPDLFGFEKRSNIVNLVISRNAVIKTKHGPFRQRQIGMFHAWIYGAADSSVRPQTARFDATVTAGINFV